MSVPAVRRIVVGVDGSVESVGALRWACREASLRGAQVHAVHVREELCHSFASYAVPAPSTAGATDDVRIEIDDLVRSVLADQAPGIQVSVEVANGLAARLLLDRCAGADMLVLGTSSDVPGARRPAGPVIRACLRRAPCPVVVISAAHDPLTHRDAAARVGETHVTVPAAIGVPAAAAV